MFDLDFPTLYDLLCEGGGEGDFPYIIAFLLAPYWPIQWQVQARPLPSLPRLQNLHLEDGHTIHTLT